MINTLISKIVYTQFYFWKQGVSIQKRVEKTSTHKQIYCAVENNPQNELIDFVSTSANVLIWDYKIVSIQFLH